MSDHQVFDRVNNDHHEGKEKRKNKHLVLLSNETGRIWWMIEEKEDGILVLVTPCGRRTIGWFIKLKYTILRSS